MKNSIFDKPDPLFKFYSRDQNGSNAGLSLHRHILKNAWPARNDDILKTNHHEREYPLIGGDDEGSTLNMLEYSTNQTPPTKRLRQVGPAAATH